MEIREAHWKLILMSDDQNLLLKNFSGPFLSRFSRNIHQAKTVFGTRRRVLSNCHLQPSSSAQSNVHAEGAVQPQWGNCPERTNGKFFFWITWELWMIQFAVESYPTLCDLFFFMKYESTFWQRKHQGEKSIPFS